ncbi:hypothetical protein TRICI_001174 [Trichomonascus ciferrii]|uniref:UPF3 domain-containing protein n=1 Tax=Trichomonascus ciferrii TaxID=44093 RepID=A0A642VBE2_9ASCO|nr:hypothetical protein TRICI_001174 [Trichomonascus ciferrii]
MTDIATVLAAKRQPAATSVTPTSTSDEGQEQKTRKVGGRKLRNKLVVRHLPPQMTQEEFMEMAKNCINEGTCEYYYYVRGRIPSKPAKLPIPSRMYASFHTPEYLRAFFREFKQIIAPKLSYQSGNGVNAVTISPMIEYAPCQGKLRDPPLPNTNGTIESDEFYKAFIKKLSDPSVELPLLGPPPPKPAVAKPKQRTQKEGQKANRSRNKGKGKAINKTEEINNKPNEKENGSSKPKKKPKPKQRQHAETSENNNNSNNEEPSSSAKPKRIYNNKKKKPKADDANKQQPQQQQQPQQPQQPRDGDNSKQPQKRRPRARRPPQDNKPKPTPATFAS